MKNHTKNLLSVALLGFGVCAGTAATAAPVTVAVLAGSSNSMSTAQVAAQLNDDSFFDFTTTVLAGSGVTSLAALAGYDVVLMGGSGYSQNEYSAATLAAVNSFMQAGGGVVTAGWYRYGVINASGQAGADADAITPVVTGGTYDFRDSTTVSFGGALHAITQGVDSFAVSGCCVEVADALDTGAVALATTSAGGIAAAYQDITGRSVYLGALYTANVGYGNDGLRSGAADRLLEQSVNWAANGSATVAPNDVPEPGSLALVLAAFAGLGLARRRG